jgi:hypothetical protein
LRVTCALAGRFPPSLTVKVGHGRVWSNHLQFPVAVTGFPFLVQGRLPCPPSRAERAPFKALRLSTRTLKRPGGLSVHFRLRHSPFRAHPSVLPIKGRFLASGCIKSLPPTVTTNHFRKGYVGYLVNKCLSPRCLPSSRSAVCTAQTTMQAPPPHLGIS